VESGVSVEPSSQVRVIIAQVQPHGAVGHNAPVRITAKADYAVRAAAELAAHPGGPVKGERIAEAQGIPLKFLENILLDLRQAQLVRSQRGPEGGYWLAKPADEIAIADILRAVEGPLAGVRGEHPEDVHYGGAADALQRVWIAVRTNLRGVLEHTTVADVASGELPAEVESLAKEPESWLTR
jgi:Rrf2 family protein